MSQCSAVCCCCLLRILLVHVLWLIVLPGRCSLQAKGWPSLSSPSQSPHPPHPCTSRCRCCSYQGLRDPLLAAALLLLHIFLASLAPTAAALSTSGPLAASTSTTCPTATSEGVQAALAACSVEGGPAVMAGFGICWFIMLNCGLLYLIAAPLMLRVSVFLLLGGCRGVGDWICPHAWMGRGLTEICSQQTCWGPPGHQLCAASSAWPPAPAPCSLQRA